MGSDRTTIASYLSDFRSRGDEIAFSHREGLRVKRWSYGEIATTAFQFARELEGRGVGKGERVLFWARNRPEWVACFFGCALRGAIAVPIDLHSEADFVSRVQDQVQAKLALIDVAGTPATKLMVPVVNLAELKLLTDRHPPAEYSANGINGDDVVEIVFTSGTTAEPKGVAITHRNLLANLTPLELEIKRYLKWERLVHPVRFLNLVPLSHVFGQFMGILVPQLLGGEVFFQESLLPSQIIETVKRERISVVVCVPRSLETLREKVERDYEARHQLARFRGYYHRSASVNVLRRWWRFRHVHQMFGAKFWAFISGGATLSADTEEFWQRLGFAVIQGYGMTETAAIISVNHPFKKAQGSIGKVLPGQDVKLSEDGEILVRGQNVTAGYWSDKPSATSTEDHWFSTGDAGELDAEGNLYFKGRKKETIVTSAGMNIYPEDLEQALDRQPEIKRSVVVQIDGSHGPEPLAVLILRDKKVDPAVAVGQANRTLAQHQQVRRWVVWPEPDFPLTSTQKVRKQVVAERIKASLASEAATANFGAASELDRIVASVSGQSAQSFVPSARLGTDLKLDSLGRVELLSALEDSYRVEFDEAAFTEATTLQDVEKLVREGKPDEPSQYQYPRWQERWPNSWLRVVLFYLVVWPFTRVMARATIRGRNRLANISGPLVFVCNHVTLADHALVLLALPRKFRRRLAIAMDGELLKQWRYPSRDIKLFTRLVQRVEYLLVVLFFNVFSMPQKSGFRRSFAFAGELMDRGYNILIFPEGERTKHGEMNPFRPGTGLLISQLNAAVVPLRLDGLWELKQAGRHFAKPGEVLVTIGEPISYARGTEAEVISRDLQTKVKDL